MTSDDRTTEPSEGTSAPDPPGTQQYEIRVKGHLGVRWAAWFDGMSLAHDDGGTTVIRGGVVDQAALHGLLEKLRDLGVPLVSLTPLPSDPPAPTAARADPPAPTAARADAITPPGPTARHDEGN